MRVLPLTGSHDRRQGFDCGRKELNDWLRQIARQHQDKGLSKTFVAVREEAPDRICAYCALTLAELESRHLPAAWRKKLPRRIPGVRLGRLAVDKAFQGKGLGELLLVDALTRGQRIFIGAGSVGQGRRCNPCAVLPNLAHKSQGADGLSAAYSRRFPPGPARPGQ